MINVLASVNIKPGKRSEFIKLFKANVPNVLAEVGCIEYVPTVDVTPALPRQIIDDNMVTIIEKWESLEALQAHLVAPHMLAYKEQVTDIVEGATIKVLEEA
jgi:quinol monooxygenase YgiN